MTTPVPAPKIKPGAATTEFWLTVATHAAWIVAFVFHRDLSAYVPAVAVGVSAAATLVYTLGRAHLKLPFSKADVRVDEQRLRPIVGALVADVEQAARSVEAALPHKAAKPAAAKTPVKK